MKYTIDDDGNTVLMHQYEWNSMNSQWDQDEKIEYSYDVMCCNNDMHYLEGGTDPEEIIAIWNERYDKETKEIQKQKIFESALIPKHPRHKSRVCEVCGSLNVIMFTADLDICEDCNHQQEGI